MHRDSITGSTKQITVADICANDYDLRMNTTYDTEHTNGEYNLRYQTYERRKQTTTQKIRTMETNYDTEHTNDQYNLRHQTRKYENKLRHITDERWIQNTIQKIQCDLYSLRPQTTTTINRNIYSKWINVYLILI